VGHEKNVIYSKLVNNPFKKYTHLKSESSVNYSLNTNLFILLIKLNMNIFFCNNISYFALYLV